MKLTNIHFLPDDQNLFDLTYPVGSIICLENSTDPNDFFGNGAGTWVLVSSGASLKISNSLTSSYTGGTAVQVNYQGTFGATTLTGAQSPRLALATLNTSSYTMTPTATNHSHTAGSSSYTYNNTDFKWYFDTAGAWYATASNPHPNITASTTNYYVLGVAATSSLSTVLTTSTNSIAHQGHTFTQAAVNAAGSHSPCFSSTPVLHSLGCPGRGLRIWQRIA